MKTVMVTQSSGMDVLKRREGGFYKVEDRVFVYLDLAEVKYEKLCPGTIKKLYKKAVSIGLREFADVLIDGEDEVRKDEMTMFFEKEV